MLEQAKSTIKKYNINFVLILFRILYFLRDILFLGYRIRKYTAGDLNNSETYVVVYEKENSFIIAECEIEGGKIAIDRSGPRKEIDRKDVEYKTMILDQD